LCCFIPIYVCVNNGKKVVGLNSLAWNMLLGFSFYSLSLAGANLLPRHPCSEPHHQDAMTVLKSTAFGIIYLQ
jgi:hypothetical protein